MTTHRRRLARLLRRSAKAACILVCAPARRLCADRCRQGAARLVAVDHGRDRSARLLSRHCRLYVRSTSGPDDVEPCPGRRSAASTRWWPISRHRILRFAKSLPEAVRMLAPGGRIRLVVHTADGVVRARRQEGDRRCRPSAEGDRPAPPCRHAASRPCSRSSATAATPPWRTRASPPSRRRSPAPRAMSRRRRTGRCSRIRARSSSTRFQRRGHFDVAQLLAKAKQVRDEIAAHRDAGIDDLALVARREDVPARVADQAPALERESRSWPPARGPRLRIDTCRRYALDA